MELIAIIEDEPNIRETLKDILELAGYDVVTAKNGREGFEIILDRSPHLVISDVSMPEMTGFELLSAINHRYGDKMPPPFLFLTAKVELADIREGMNLGADDYILKPFDHTEVLDAIRMRLDKRAKMFSTNRVVPNHLKNTLALPSEDGLEFVDINRIVRCEAERAYCQFYLEDGSEIMVSKPMRTFEDTLIEHGFFRVHKSSIVNLQFVQRYVRGKGGYLVMKDGSHINVSVRKKEALLELLKGV